MTASTPPQPAQEQVCGERFGLTGVCDMAKGHPPISEAMGWLHGETVRFTVPSVPQATDSTTAGTDMWDYATHPGDCHPRKEDGTWTTCCRECAGTGVFPVPWINSPAEGRDDPDASCVACKASGRTVVGLAATPPSSRADGPTADEELAAHELMASQFRTMQQEKEHGWREAERWQDRAEAAEAALASRPSADTELRARVLRLVLSHGIADTRNGELFADRLDDLLRAALDER